MFTLKSFLEKLQGYYILEPETADRIAASVIQWTGIPAGTAGSFMICGFSYRRKETVLPPLAPHGLVAPFARRNYYKAAVIRLKKVASRLAAITGLPGKSIRIFCNSRLPEKLMALLGGFGFAGKNSLIINEALGSHFIIAGLFIPVEIAGIPQPVEKHPGCGECRKCIDACPAGAIAESGRMETSIDLKKCFQSLSTQRISLPGEVMAGWGRRIYGCGVCQQVCPYNKKLPLPEKYPFEELPGDLGPYVLLEDILGPGDAEVKLFLKKTVMGLSWIDVRAIKRNGLIAAGNSEDRSVVPLVRKYLNRDEYFLNETARIAMMNYI